MEHKKGTITNVVIDSSSRITGTTAEDAQYRIAWDSILGSGRYKMSWKYIDIPNIPNAPTNLRSTVLSSSTTSVIFTPVAGATSYTITSSPSGFTGTGASSPITVSGLAPNTIYTFTATATTITGTSLPSIPSVAITTMPSPPTNVIAMIINSTSASISFTAPTGGNGTITSYTVTSSPSTIVVSGASSPITVSGLTPNTAYTFTVIATNSGGASTYNFRVKSLTNIVPATVDGFTLINQNSVAMINDATRGYVFNFTGANLLSIALATPVNSTKSFWLSNHTPTTGSNAFSTTKCPIWFDGGTFLKASVNFTTSAVNVFSTIAQTATWLFYTITTTPTATTMYVNGTQVATANVVWTGDSANMVFGGYQSGNFIVARMDDIRFYSSILTPTEIATLYTSNSGTTSAPSTASTAKTTFTEFQQLLITKPAWGRYSASSWVQGTQILTDETSNGRHALGLGTAMTQASASGNGATASITYINGVPGSQLQWPVSSIPTANHTICFITRYSSATQQRIMTSSDRNYVLGHHQGKRGLVYSGDGGGGGWKTNLVTIPPTTDWLNMCYTSGNSIPNNVLVNGVGQGTATGSENQVARLAINMYSGGEFSDFQLAQTVIWNQVLTPAEMVIVSNAYANLLLTAVLVVPTAFQQLLINKPPWGRYSASSWNTGTQILTDETGNGRHGVGAGAITQTTASGNGATVPIPYIQGITTDTILFPAGSIPNAHTICCVSRYASGSNQQRIFASQTDNVIIGHQLSRRGIIYNGSFRTNTVTTPPTLDWLNLCYTNGAFGTNPNPNNILVNGVGIGTSSGGNGIVSRLSVNIVGVYPTEISDFQIAQLLIWDVALTPEEMVIVSNAYAQFLSTGILS